MTDLNSLIVFAYVIDANSFSGAARILKMPTSTVSRRVAELEDQLGVRLIERSTRRLRLTDAGSEVLEHARRMVELSDAVDNAASICCRMSQARCDLHLHRASPTRCWLRS